ncbi:hypothetical protein Fot_06375 [Forsythia ovata]|uniref:Uncharacterized protein n=1 Tax=Forsythia ovata TaxID=205694 RepID=A0ABD1WT53_9LAMI
MEGLIGPKVCSNQELLTCKNRPAIYTAEPPTIRAFEVSEEEESQANKGLIYPDGVGYKTPSTIGQPRERGGPKVSVGYGISPPIRKGRKIVYKKLHSKLGKKRKGAGGPDGVGWKTPSREMKEGRQMLQGTREQVDEGNLVGVGQREQMTKTVQ